MTLTKADIEKTKKQSIKDGSAWSVMYGFGEQYIIPFALRLGATNSEIGILGSVPAFIGAAFQLLGARLTDKYQNRKKIVTVMVFFQALLLLPLFIIPFLTKSMLLLTVLFTAYTVFANIMGPSWSSWISDVIPENERAKYFGMRNKYVVASTMFSVMIAGIILNLFENINIWAGFGILFVIAFIGRMISWYYLTKQIEPKYEYNPENYFSFKDFIKRMPETNFGNFVIFRSLMALAVMIAGPFFAVFMLKDMGFSYLQYTAVILVPMAAKAFTMTYWGKYSQRFGTRNIMIVSGVWIATIPVWWFIAGYFFTITNAFYIILIAEIMSGFSWAGFELTTFNYVLETVSPEKRARGFAYFNMIFGFAVLAGGLLGTLLVGIIPGRVGLTTIMIVFIISAFARLIVMLFFTRRIKEVKVSRQIDENKLFFELIIAKPVNNALQYTAAGLLKTESDMKRIANNTTDVFDRLADPVRPYIEGFVDVVDEELNKIDHIRIGLEPKIIKKHKKKMYSGLVNSRLNKKMSRQYMKKKRRK
jgi:MFS family permease